MIRGTNLKLFEHLFLLVVFEHLVFLNSLFKVVYINEHYYSIRTLGGMPLQ